MSSHNTRQRFAAPCLLAVAVLLLAPAFAMAQDDSGGDAPTGGVQSAETDGPTGGVETPSNGGAAGDGQDGDEGEQGTEGDDEGDAEGGKPGGGGGGIFGGDWTFLIIIMGVFLLMYIFMGSGRRKEQAKRKQMLENIKKGDKVTTIGGVCGTITDVRENEVVVKVDDNARMKFARWAIRGVGDEAKTEGPEEKK